MQTLNRRNFLKSTALAGAGFVAAPLAGLALEQQAKTAKKLILAHTNDVHSRLEPFPMDGSRNAGMGGVARRASMIEQLRKEHGNSFLLVDAGDIFQGTPYFNLYKGEPEIKAMTKMGYDAATIGNHDFDGGLENLATQMMHASFPLVVANYDFSGTPMEGKTIPYHIIKKGDLKIGITGVGIELKGLVPESLYLTTKYLSPIEQVNVQAAYLKKKGCDLIVCLSHLGDKYNDNKVSDEVLAKETEWVDVIIGGHTHRFFEQPRTYKNKKGYDVIVNQAGWGGIQLGILELQSSTAKDAKLIGSKSLQISEKNAN